MRIAAALKMGYYPTPPQTLEQIAQLLRPAARGGSLRLLDPCAGEGEALGAISSALAAHGAEVETIGVELSDTRAAVAETVLDRCICADWADITCSHKSFSLLWLNPPYDAEAGQNQTRKRRLEYVFLQNTLKVLQPGGLLVYIVPLKLLGQTNVAKFLAGYFEHVSVYLLPGDESERFGQIVLFGNRKAKPFLDEPVMEELLAMAEREDLPKLDACREPILVPSATLPASKFFVRKITLAPEEVLQVVNTHGVHTTRHWTDMLSRMHDGAFTPGGAVAYRSRGQSHLLGPDGHGAVGQSAGQGTLTQDLRVGGRPGQPGQGRGPQGGSGAGTLRDPGLHAGP